jgi:hypothetical protein
MMESLPFPAPTFANNASRRNDKMDRPGREAAVDWPGSNADQEPWFHSGNSILEEIFLKGLLTIASRLGRKH